MKIIVLLQMLLEKLKPCSKPALSTHFRTMKWSTMHSKTCLPKVELLGMIIRLGGKKYAVLQTMGKFSINHFCILIFECFRDRMPRNHVDCSVGKNLTSDFIFERIHFNMHISRIKWRRWKRRRMERKQRMKDCGNVRGNQREACQEATKSYWTQESTDQ